MKIIKVTEVNIDELVVLFDQYMVFYKKPSAPEKYKEYLLQRIINDEATIYLALNDTKEPIGFVLNYYSFSSVSQGKGIILNDLYVSPSERKKGVATQLISSSKALAQETGAIRVDLSPANDNIFAQTLYEKIGFVKDTEFYSYSLSIEQKN